MAKSKKKAPIQKKEADEVAPWVYTENGEIKTNLEALLESEQGKETLNQIKELREKLAKNG